MAYFASSGSSPGILGETIAAALNVNAMLWRTAPAATELEQVALDWLRQMVGLPEPLFGVINDTASSSTLYALAAAREAQADLRIRELGLAGRPELPRLRYYASTEAHSSVEKAGIVLGIGREGLAANPGRRAVPDGSGRASPGDPRGHRRRDPAVRGGRHRRDDVDDERRSDRGHRVLSASSTACGCTSTRRTAAPRRSRRSCAGCSTAPSAPTPSSSIRTSGCSRRSTAASCGRGDRRCCAARSRSSPSTSRHPTVRKHDAPNLMDYGTSLGRRMRALKLWMVIRHFGTDGLAARIREHCELRVDRRALGGARARLRNARSCAAQRRVSAGASTRTRRSGNARHAEPAHHRANQHRRSLLPESHTRCMMRMRSASPSATFVRRNVTRAESSMRSAVPSMTM